MRVVSSTIAIFAFWSLYHSKFRIWNQNYYVWVCRLPIAFHRHWKRMTLNSHFALNNVFLVESFSVDALILRHDCRSLFAIIFRMTFPTGGLIFCPWCFFLCLFSFAMQLLSEVPRPIAVKLCHMIGKLHQLGNLTLIESKNSEAIPQKLGPKTCKISVNFGPLPTLTANISGTRQRIQNQKDVRTSKIPPAFDEKSPVNFGPLTAWNYMLVWTH